MKASGEMSVSDLQVPAPDTVGGGGGGGTCDSPSFGSAGGKQEDPGLGSPCDAGSSVK